jgi:hypothetical protein
MASELMVIQDIKSRYEGEWVLLVDCETDEFSNIVKGRVQFHSLNRQAVFEELVKNPSRRKTATIYAGEIPKDLAVML